MGRIIVKLEEFYLEWSSVTDSPVTFGMTREEFEAYHRDEYGANGHRDFGQRMKRVQEKGTSSHYGTTAAEAISSNRAGPNESELTQEEIYQAYCLQKPIRDGWLVPSA